MRVRFIHLIHVSLLISPLLPGIAQYSQSLVACRRMMDFFDADELEPYVAKEERDGGVVVSMTNANLGLVDVVY